MATLLTPTSAATDGMTMAAGNIDKDAERLVGRYANYLKIGCNAFEFLFDFGQSHPDEREPQFHTRLITSPAYAKAFLETFRDAVENYESEYGVIPADKEHQHDAG